jgi:hypothetical protein
MKLTDILRQINEEEEEDNKGQEFNIPKNMTLRSISIPVAKLEDYLNDSSNYGMYSRNIQNVGSSALQAKIEQEKSKIFGPTGKSMKDRTPPAKIAKAKELWNSSDAGWRKDKAKDIKSRFPEFDTTGWEELEFDELPKEAKKYNVFWDFITGPKLDALLKRVKSEFSTQENPLNWEEEDGRLIFPPDTNPKFDVIKKTVNTVMKNAGIPKEEYELKPEDIKGFIAPKQEIPTTPQPAGPSVLTLTLDPDKIKGKKPELNNIVKLLKNTYDKNFDYNKETNVIKIANIKPERRDIVRSQFGNFLKKTDPIKESLDFDLERYQMLRRAGIIK